MSEEDIEPIKRMRELEKGVEAANAEIAELKRVRRKMIFSKKEAEDEISQIESDIESEKCDMREIGSLYWQLSEIISKLRDFSK